VKAEAVPPALEGERLDRLVALVCDCSRSVASKLVTNGAVRIDGDVVTARSERVAAGAMVEIDYDPQVTVALPVADSSIDIDVVHEDADLAVINKHAGLVVHPGAGNETGTLVNALLARYPEIADVGAEDRPGIVHRLDRGTSGLLAVARTAAAYEGLVEALSERRVQREYLAVAWGTFADDRGTIDAPIGRSTRHRTRMAVIDAGRDARTHYEVLDRRHDDPPMSLVHCRLETGRTHQIRVHLQAIGHSVVGDPVYGGLRGNSVPFIEDAAAGGRPALHAQRLAFTHPITDEHIDCAVDAPADMQTLIADYF